MNIAYLVAGILWIVAGGAWIFSSAVWFANGSKGLGWFNAALVPLNWGVGVMYLLLATGVWS